MHPIDAPDSALPLHGREGTRAIEQQHHIALPHHTLKQRAGLAVARLAQALAPHAQRVWVAAGPGNNGGDGLEAALHLHRQGRRVTVTLCADAAQLPPDAQHALVRAQAGGVAIGGQVPPEALGPDDLCIDALLGVGATRAPQGALAEMVHQLNAAPCPVLAVDLPTGLDADTGQPFNDTVVHALHTAALLTLKPGLFTGQGRDMAGRVWFDALGIDVQACSAPPVAWLTGQQQLRALLPPRRHAQHKGSFGDVMVVGGAPGMLGAVTLAAGAALAAGAGRVIVHALDGDAPAHDPHRPELMWRTAAIPVSPDGWARNTVVSGCGGGDLVAARLPELLSRAGRLVLDADALNAIAGDSALRTLLRARRTAGKATIVTPHPLEAARLLGSDAQQVQSDRLAAAAELARQLESVVLLKGSGTVVAAPGQISSINPTGNAALACPGSGDVLAGWIGGLWSTLGARDSESTAFGLAQAAAHQHGAAADAAPWRSLRAADLIEALRLTR